MYLAFDAETTGLDPEHDQIIEIGWTFLDDDLHQKKPVESRLVTASPTIRELLRTADPVVIDMHTKTGLLRELDEEGTLMRHDIEDLILKDIQNHAEKDSQIILFGMGPHFDHEFIRNWLPRLNNKLHYRHYDVRTLIEFFDDLGIEHGVVNLCKHRAGPDVSESIQIAQSYKSWILDNADRPLPTPTEIDRMMGN